MNLGTMIVAVVLIVCITGAYTETRKARTLNDEDREQLADLSERLKRIEERLANLESIVLEREKVKSFDDAL